VYVRANHEAQTRLQRDLGRRCTEQIIVAESTLGRRVRNFSKSSSRREWSLRLAVTVLSSCCIWSLGGMRCLRRW
jgi:hypothetical protein